MDVSEVESGELPVDVDVISVYSYEGAVVVAFIDSSGEHGAVMDPDEAEALAKSLLRAADVSSSWDEGAANVN